MKTVVIFLPFSWHCPLYWNGYSGTVISLSDADKSLIVKAHNDIRSDVSPTAANMVKLVNQYIHTHTHTTTLSCTHTCTHMQECFPILHTHKLKSAHMLTATKLKETKQELLLSLQSLKTS